MHVPHTSLDTLPAGSTLHVDPAGRADDVATSSAIQAGFQWEIREDVTNSEHRNIEAHIGADEAKSRKRLTRFT